MLRKLLDTMSHMERCRKSVFFFSDEIYCLVSILEMKIKARGRKKKKSQNNRNVFDCPWLKCVYSLSVWCDFILFFSSLFVLSENRLIYTNNLGVLEVHYFIWLEIIKWMYTAELSENYIVVFFVLFFFFFLSIVVIICCSELCRLYLNYCRKWEIS